MMKQILYFILISLTIFEVSANQLTSENKYLVSQNELQWRIGGKIHFEEKNDADYIGIKEVNKLARTALKTVINIEDDTCAENAKVLVKKEASKIQLTHFEEKSRPGIGEEMHATLLYTQSRGFCDSETLQQVSKNLFRQFDFPPTLENVASRYNSIIKPEWEFEILEAVLTKGANSTSFVMLKLLFEGQDRLFYEGNPISAGLHMTLINFADSTLISNESAHLLVKEINQALKGRKIKIAQKNGIADLEFGISGSSWRIRAGERWK